MKFPFGKSLLSLLVAATLPAYATSYYVVVPVPAKTAASNAITVYLTPAIAPMGQVGVAYAGFDLRKSLTVTGDPKFTGYGVKWSIIGGALPAGLTLNSNGTITGTPTAAGTSTFSVRASYMLKNGEQSYQVLTYQVVVALAGGSPPQAIVGQAYNYNLAPLLTVSGDPNFNPNGVTWSVVSSTLPAGLYLTASGAIAGTPTAGGTGNIVARATYKGVNGQQTYQVVSLNVSVALAAGTPPQAILGQAYSYDLSSLLSVTGDTGFKPSDVNWSVVSSTLPAGLSLTADGHIAGTPTASGTGTITAQASYRGVNGQQTYQVVTLAINVALATGTPPQAIVGQAYNYNLTPLLTVSGDAAYTGTGVTWNVISSSLPSGLSLTSDGRIAGTPTAAGSGSVTVQASYRGVNGQQTYQVMTLNIGVSLAAGSPPQAIVGQTYSYALAPLLSVSGDSSYSGTGVTWSVVSSSLPSGLYLTSDGHIAGTPTAAGTGTITAQASYRGVNGQQTYQVVTLNIVVSLASATLPVGVTNNGYAGYDFKSVLSVTGDASYTPSAATWSVVSGALPAGLSLSSTGVLSGTPTTAAVSSFTLQAAYRNQTARTGYSLEVDAASVPGSLTASSTDFGSVVVGSSAARSFTFTNNGNTTATGLYASVSGTALALTSSSCGTAGAPVTLAKGASCSFTVTFTPTTAGANTGTVATTWTGPNSSSKSLAVTDAATVNYSSLMNGFATANVAIGTNASWTSAIPWYWLSANAQSSAAAGTFEFRRQITVGGTSPITAYLYGAVDDALTSISVNGVTQYTNLSMPFNAVNTTPSFTLQPGVNVIGVQITNAGTAANPAGIALQVRQSTGAVLGDFNGWFHQ
ncbi:putative Ig domain-containing protein [Burkholderia multivorans]|uniref:beta strand repeat-containing protein n=1 Tax=Burkholderia multivorans TaxID=87883 RepID=UPI001C250320|nr:putative Ig domain-containing protein [Burkholderia multivorans]MBU9199945.1 putative Ig domain-containing protein [Burkholderia multivorans]MDN8078936.1 putative Ig domain-containing protein [Burkholderia multivorans]